MGLFDILNEARMMEINGNGHDEIDAQSELDGWMDREGSLHHLLGSKCV